MKSEDKWPEQNAFRMEISRTLRMLCANALCCRFVLAAGANNNLNHLKSLFAHTVLKYSSVLFSARKRSSQTITFVKMLERLHEGSVET